MDTLRDVSRRYADLTNVSVSTLTQNQAIFAHRKQGHLSSIGQVISVEKWAEVRVLFHREGWRPGCV